MIVLTRFEGGEALVVAAINGRFERSNGVEGSLHSRTGRV